MKSRSDSRYWTQYSRDGCVPWSTWRARSPPRPAVDDAVDVAAAVLTDEGEGGGAVDDLGEVDTLVFGGQVELEQEGPREGFMACEP